MPLGTGSCLGSKGLLISPIFFYVLGLWETACNQMGLATLGHVALNAHTQ